MEEKIFGKRFVGQVALVTGGAKGIGQACALRFAKEGANVALLDFDDDNNEKSAAACRAHDVQTLAIHCDVCIKEGVQSALDQVMKAWGQVDIVVASAGVYSGSMLPDVRFEDWQRVIETDLTGVFLTDQAVAPILMAQRSGSIINIASIAGVTSWHACAEYSAAKTGVIGLTRSVAVELAPYGVTCNALCPGCTRTDILLDVARSAGMSSVAWMEARARESPAGRVAEPWEMAGVAAFLASNDARYINGQSIVVDGGINM